MPVRGLRANPRASAKKKGRKRIVSQIDPDGGKGSRAAARRLEDQPFRLRAVLGEKTPLETDAVEPVTEGKYQCGWNIFVLFLALFNLSLEPLYQADLVLTDFINYAWSQGMEFSEMANVVSAVRDKCPALSKFGPIKLPRMYRAMAGWRKRQPSVTRPPVPALLVYAVAGQLLESNVLAALCLLTLLSTYCRPTEGTRLCRRDLVAPGRSVQFYSLNLNADEGEHASKVNARNETLLLDDPELPMLGALLDRFCSRVPEAPLFPLSPAQLGNLFAKEQRNLGVTSLYNLRDLRHGGPSRDRAKKFRSIEEVRQRGRWASLTTLRRYEAHARLQKEENKLPETVAAKASSALKKLECLHQKFSKLGVASRGVSSLSSSRVRRASPREPPVQDMRSGRSTLSSGMISSAPPRFCGLKRSAASTLL